MATLQQLVERDIIPVDKNLDMREIASLFVDEKQQPFYFAKRSDLDTKLNNIPYIMSIAKGDGRVYVDYDQSIEVCKDKQTAAKFILEYFARK
jgi:hypothetical protein